MRLPVAAFAVLFLLASSAGGHTKDRLAAEASVEELRTEVQRLESKIKKANSAIDDLRADTDRLQVRVNELEQLDLEHRLRQLELR